MNNFKVVFLPACLDEEAPVFEKETASREQALFLLNNIAEYTLMLGDSHLMHDFTNHGFLMTRDQNNEWVEEDPDNDLQG